MRSGTKKTKKSAANLQTRRCVVRVKRMKTPTNKNNKRTVAARPEPSTSAKRTVGPAKANTTLSTSLKAKDRLKTPTVARNIKAVQQAKRAESPAVEELPPTIAAGRSRRAHKPNPKYANDDIFTPKNLKSSTVSSFEDKFNDSDREGPRTSKSSKLAKLFELDSDSDFDNIDNELNEDSDGSVYERKTRGRPVKTAAVETSVRRSTAGAGNTSTTPRNAPTQLQQLRRTLNASNVSPLALGKKRKLEESSQSATTAIAAKRPNVPVSTPKLAESNGFVRRRQSPSVASTESKAKFNVTTGREIQERKASPLALKRAASVANLKTAATTSKSQQNVLQRGLANRNSLGKASSASTPSLSKSSNVGRPTSGAPSSVAATKARNSLTRAVQSPLGSTKTAAVAGSNSDVEELSTVTIDDFETMPTFTIVNINDIINKKGDVLISEASGKGEASTPPTKPEPKRNVQKQQQTQAQQSKPLNKKQSAAVVKTSQPLGTSTPMLKKAAEKVGNNALNKVINRNSTGSTKSSPTTQKSTISPATTKPSTRSGNASEKKPAPRILNSVVSPRTKPIKPVIANLDISDDDPSGSISLYTDEDDFDGNDDDEEVVFKNDSTISDSDYSDIDREVVKRKKKRVQPKRSPISTATGKGKANTRPNAAKENSAAINNCLPKKQAMPTKPAATTRKLSPEKVVVQREGNKIIKKITCFETWYVINIPADAPEEYERNTLEMPLIELANSAKTLSLPTEKWTTKVTLYELKKSMSKSNLIIYNGDLDEHNIKESDRANYQPSCVMFRRTVPDRVKLQLPYDRAVIFKNKTFFTNIEGKNVKLVGAPTSIKDYSEVETLLNIVDGLTLQSPFVEPASTIL